MDEAAALCHEGRTYLQRKPTPAEDSEDSKGRTAGAPESSQSRRKTCWAPINRHASLLAEVIDRVSASYT